MSEWREKRVTEEMKVKVARSVLKIRVWRDN